MLASREVCRGALTSREVCVAGDTVVSASDGVRVVARPLGGKPRESLGVDVTFDLRRLRDLQDSMSSLIFSKTSSTSLASAISSSLVSIEYNVFETRIVRMCALLRACIALLCEMHCVVACVA